MTQTALQKDSFLEESLNLCARACCRLISVIMNVIFIFSVFLDKLGIEAQEARESLILLET